MNREIDRAGTCDPEAVAKVCQRKVIKMKWGILDMCTVNCEYPVLIEKKSIKYKERTPWISA